MDTRRRLNASSVRDINGCLKCGEDHVARKRQSNDKGINAVERLKARHPASRLLVEDLATMGEMAYLRIEQNEDVLSE